MFQTRLLFRLETLLLSAAILLCGGAAVTYYLTRATTLTIAVAPKDGTEPALIQAFSNALQANQANIRLNITSFDDTRESAAALQNGHADLAVVRPDIAIPRNGLTLAILRDQAMIIVSPKSAGIDEFRELAKKRLGFIAEHQADLAVIKSLGAFYNLDIAVQGKDVRRESDASDRLVTLVPLSETDVPTAFAKRTIDAVIIIIAPAAPRALRLVQSVIEVSKGRTVNFVAVPDDDAVIERLPKLQAVTIPAGLFHGIPKAPAEEVKTVGTSYRLMARSSLSRTLASDVTQHLFEMRSEMAESTEAADYILPPSYDSTVAATSARLPNHPGAIDYFEREQKSFIDRYSDLVYLVALLAGGLGSVFAWFKQRYERHRLERVDAMLAQLDDIRNRVAGARDDADPRPFRLEIDEVAMELAKNLQERDVGQNTISAVVLAIDAARSAVVTRWPGLPDAKNAPLLRMLPNEAE